MKGKTWNQFTKGLGFPSQFRIVVIKEEEQFSTVSLDWYLCASGGTLEKSLQLIEQVIFSQAAILVEFKDKHGKCQKMNPAPEDYQRIAKSGDYFVCTDRAWKRWFSKKMPVVHRGTINMAKSKFKLHENKEDKP